MLSFPIMVRGLATLETEFIYHHKPYLTLCSFYKLHLKTAGTAIDEIDSETGTSKTDMKLLVMT